MTGDKQVEMPDHVEIVKSDLFTNVTWILFCAFICFITFNETNSETN